MYTIISGTNRKDSNTIKIAEEYQSILDQKGIKASLVSLVGLDVNMRNPQIQALEQEIFIPTEKFIFIIPEYNGSFPGVLKSLIDISDIKKVWPGKKALLTGVATGRAGNLRGLDHFTSILHYVKMNVHHNKLPISIVDKLLDDEASIHDPATVKVINTQLDEFINF